MTMEFLKKLLTTPGPSTEETRSAQVWREEAATFADNIQTDVRGNTFAILNGADLPRVLLAGHIDEIGVIVTHIDEKGFVYFGPVGGWDPQVLVGQRIRLLGREGELIGVVGKKAIHLMKPEERKNASQIDDLWIDIGAKDRDEALQWVQVGTVGVIDVQPYELPHGRVVSRSIDNRIGAYTVLEALRLMAVDRPKATVAAVATTQEEIGLAGAATAAFSFDPQVSIAVDVTHATDYPEAKPKQSGEASLGGGPSLTVGSVNSPVVFRMLVDVAEKESIPYSVKVTPRFSGTDGDAIYRARGGVATAVISIPNRYMHSPNEMIQMSDVEHAAQLIAAFVRSLSSETDFIPV